MILKPYIRNLKSLNKRRLHGFTLAEMLLAMTIFIMAVTGLLSTQLFGLRQDELASSKSGACEQARNAFNDLANDIRTAKLWQVGNGSLSTFTPIPNGTAQQGNAIQVCLTTDTNKYVVYYFDTNSTISKTLYRRHSGSSARVLAQFLTNTMYFQAEDYRGSLQTNLTHKGVIHVRMEYFQFQYPLTLINSNAGNYYNYYKTEFRITSHVPDGS